MKGFKVETGQVKFKPQHSMRMGTLTNDQRDIEQKLRLHRIAMQRLKRTNPSLYREFKKQGL